jgi:hypothetical protein
VFASCVHVPAASQCMHMSTYLSIFDIGRHSGLVQLSLACVSSHPIIALRRIARHVKPVHHSRSYNKALYTQTTHQSLGLPLEHTRFHTLRILQSLCERIRLSSKHFRITKVISCGTSCCPWWVGTSWWDSASLLCRFRTMCVDCFDGEGISFFMTSVGHWCDFD